MGNELPDKNLFMMCEKLNPHALSPMPEGYHVRSCRRDELAIWKAMPFDDEETAWKHDSFMTNYFQAVYEGKEELFFEQCFFVCDQDDFPVGTCMAWKAYDRIMTIHWFKILKEYEGQGIGRALLSRVMKEIAQEDYPVFLHTQPESARAIKLYTDFGFIFLTDPVIGQRQNDLAECLPLLKEQLLPTDFEKLKHAPAPAALLEAASSSSIDQF